MADPTDNAPDYWTHTATLAREGSTEAARDILREFAEAVQLSSKGAQAVPIPRVCAEFLAESFRQILNDDADAEHALCLRARKAGRPRGSGSKDRDPLRLGAAYWLLVRRGNRPEKAIELIHEATSADRTTVQDARDACSIFEVGVDDNLLLTIISEQPALAKIIPPA